MNENIAIFNFAIQLNSKGFEKKYNGTLVSRDWVFLSLKFEIPQIEFNVLLRIVLLVTNDFKFHSATAFLCFKYIHQQ